MYHWKGFAEWSSSRSDGTHTQNGVRIKTWPGGQYGYGKVHNITYEDIQVSGVDKPIVVDTCYMNTVGVGNRKNFHELSTDPLVQYCALHPSLVNMTDVYIRRVTGGSSGANGDSVASLICSPSAVCELHLADINITPPSGDTPIFNCTNVNADVGVPCTPWYTLFPLDPNYELWLMILGPVLASNESTRLWYPYSRKLEYSVTIVFIVQSRSVDRCGRPPGGG